MDIQALIKFVSGYRKDKRYDPAPLIIRCAENYETEVKEELLQVLSSKGRDYVNYYANVISDSYSSGGAITNDNIEEYAKVYQKNFSTFVADLYSYLRANHIDIPQADYVEHMRTQGRAVQKRFGNIKVSIIKDRNAQKATAKKAVAKKSESIVEPTVEPTPEPAATPIVEVSTSAAASKKSTTKKPTKSASTKKATTTKAKSTAKKSTATRKKSTSKATSTETSPSTGFVLVGEPQTVVKDSLVAAPSTNRYAAGSPMAGMFHTGSSRVVEGEIVNDIPDVNRGNAYNAFAYLYYMNMLRGFMQQRSKSTLPGVGKHSAIGSSTMYALPEHGSGRYGKTTNIYDSSVSDFNKNKAREDRINAAKERLNQTIPSSGVIKMGSGSFKEEQERARKKKEQQGFLRDLLTGIKKIMGKNPLGDLIKLACLMLGKHHPILAAIGLMLPTLIAPIMGLWKVITSVNRGLQSLGKGYKAIFPKGIKATLPTRAAVGGGFKAFFGKGGQWGGKVLDQAGNLGKAARFAARGGGVLTGLLSFGLNKMSGQSTGEAASRATGSTVGGILGGAAMAWAGPIGIAVGSVVGGLFGDWIGGKLFGLMNRQHNEEDSWFNKITDWLAKIFPWIKKDKDGDNNNLNNSGSGSYGDPRPDSTSVKTTTPEEKAKAEATYKYDLEMYQAAKDDKMAGWGKGGAKKARQALVERWTQDYVNKKMNGIMYDTTALGQAHKQADRDKFTIEGTEFAQKKLEDYLANEGNRLKQVRANLDNSTVVDAKYGNPTTYKTTTVNGVSAVNLHDLGLYGNIKYSRGANSYIGAGRVGRMKELDEVYKSFGIKYNITSTMGDSHKGGPRSHYMGNKIDVVPIGNVPKEKMDALHKELLRRGFYDEGGSRTGAVGWHNAGSGYHDDLTLLTAGELSLINKGKRLTSVTPTQKAATTEANTTTPETVSNAVASTFLRSGIAERAYGNNTANRTQELIFTATDITGSLGVWGITHKNNTGK